MKFEGTSILTRVQGFIPAESSLPIYADDPEPPKKHNVSFATVRTIYHSAIFEDLQAGRTIGIAHSLYDKHQKYGSDWNPWHPFAIAFDYQQALAHSSQGNTRVDEYLRDGLDCCRTTSFQSASELWEILRNLDFGLGANGWYETSGHHGAFYFRDIFDCIKFLLGHLPIAKDLDFVPVQLFVLWTIRSTRR